ncbi:MAG: GNAT family N-acetyltransferase, partial [bacterium]
MYKFGLKLWSTNKNYIKPALDLYENGFFSYIELFSVPGSFQDYVHIWKQLTIPFIIHAPHSETGLNLAKKNQFKTNMHLAQEALRYADQLNADTIIFHPGIDGDIQETIRQINIINDPRVTIENKPYYTVNDDRICVGHSPEQIKKILNQTNTKFCLDLAHGVCSANAQHTDPFVFLEQFSELKPYMFHITDGNIHGARDIHEHIGHGSFDVQKLLQIVPHQSYITIETPKSSQEHLDDFINDIKQLKKAIILDQNFFKISPAKKTDIKDLFELANDPIVRKNSLNQETILWENHVPWFAKKLENKDTIFYVLQTNTGRFVGYVRFDEDDDLQGHVISVALVQNFRGYGIGPLLI